MSAPGVLVAKGLGGSGIHNAMVYMRALPSDVRSWNVSGWSWEDALKSYMDLEAFYTEERMQNTSLSMFHGTKGPIITTVPTNEDGISPDFIASAVNSGLKLTQDFNAPGGREGVGYYHYNIAGGVRESAARKMIGPMLAHPPDYPTFELSLRSTATRLILASPPDMAGENDAGDTGDVNVLGVYYEKDGQEYAAYLKESDWTTRLSPSSAASSTRAVVLTCGALLSPQLLMRSGIGPKEELMRAGLEMRVNAEGVGKGLQDHPAIALVYSISPELAASRS